MQHRNLENGEDIGTVLQRFPEHEAGIRELVRRDQQFRELCTDYGDCVAALQRFQNQGVSAVERVEQYAEFRASLEEELLAGIARHSERDAADQ